MTNYIRPELERALIARPLNSLTELRNASIIRIDASEIRAWRVLSKSFLFLSTGIAYTLLTMVSAVEILTKSLFVLLLKTIPFVDLSDRITSAKNSLSLSLYASLFAIFALYHNFRYSYVNRAVVVKDSPWGPIREGATAKSAEEIQNNFFHFPKPINHVHWDLE